MLLTEIADNNVRDGRPRWKVEYTGGLRGQYKNVRVVRAETEKDASDFINKFLGRVVSVERLPDGDQPTWAQQ